MDGTFTKEIFGLTVLLAVSVDTDNHAVTIAWALVGGDSESSWWRFFHIFTQRCRASTPIMSDRDKGIRAADNEIPLANRVFCVEHISRKIDRNYAVPSRVAFNAHIRFSLTEE